MQRARARIGVGSTLAALLSIVPVRTGRADETGDDVVWIAGGAFTFGATPDDLDEARKLCVRERIARGLGLRGCADDQTFAAEHPATRMQLPGYGIDRYEVSRAEHARCVEAGGCDPSAYVSEHPGLVGDDLPIVGLRWADALALCRFRGGRLPSEAEWERAARGDSRRRFPWGAFYNEQLANHGAPSAPIEVGTGGPSGGDGFVELAPVRAFAAARSPHGLVQMAGNVWEWTADPFVRSRRADPSPPGDGGLRVVRGGSFRSPAFALRVTHREGRSERGVFVDVGVRCAYDLPEVARGH